MLPVLFSCLLLLFLCFCFPSFCLFFPALPLLFLGFYLASFSVFLFSALLFRHPFILLFFFCFFSCFFCRLFWACLLYWLCFVCLFFALPSAFSLSFFVTDCFLSLKGNLQVSKRNPSLVMITLNGLYVLSYSFEHWNRIHGSCHIQRRVSQHMN